MIIKKYKKYLRFLLLTCLHASTASWGMNEVKTANVNNDGILLDNKDDTQPAVVVFRITADPESYYVLYRRYNINEIDEKDSSYFRWNDKLIAGLFTGKDLKKILTNDKKHISIAGKEYPIRKLCIANLTYNDRARLGRDGIPLNPPYYYYIIEDSVQADADVHIKLQQKLHGYRLGGKGDDNILNNTQRCFCPSRFQEEDGNYTRWLRMLQSIKQNVGILDNVFYPEETISSLKNNNPEVPEFDSTLNKNNSKTIEVKYEQSNNTKKKTKKNADSLLPQFDLYATAGMIGIALGNIVGHDIRYYLAQSAVACSCYLLSKFGIIPGKNRPFLLATTCMLGTALGAELSRAISTANPTSKKLVNNNLTNR